MLEIALSVGGTVAQSTTVWCVTDTFKYLAQQKENHDFMVTGSQGDSVTAT